MKRYITTPGVILTSICGRHYLVTIKETVEINETAAACWKILEKGSDLPTLAALIKNSYEIESAVKLEDDILKLTDALLEKDMILRCQAE